MKPLLFLIAIGPVVAACLPVETERITGGDLAKAVPQFARISNEPVAYAPIPGAKRIMNGGELRRIATRFGIELTDAPDLCFEFATQRLTESDTLTAMQQSVSTLNAQIEVIELSRYAVPRGTVTFPLIGLHAPPFATDKSVVLWRGWQIYGGGKRFPVWARVKIWTEGERLLARRDIRPGEEIHEEDLSLETCRYFPIGAEPTPDREALVGRTAKMRISAKTPIAAAALSKRRYVAPGADVNVVVAGDSMKLSFAGKAETAGGLGDPVRILNPSTGRRFQAVVSGPHSVSVDVIKQ